MDNEFYMALTDRIKDLEAGEDFDITLSDGTICSISRNDYWQGENDGYMCNLLSGVYLTAEGLALALARYLILK